MTGSGTGKSGRPPGLPKTGGRTKGTPNRSTVALHEKLATLGCDPAEELLKIAQGPKTVDGVKVQIYAMLLPYVYAKRKPIEEADEEGVNTPTMTPKQALDWAHFVIRQFGPGTETQPDATTSNESDAAFAAV